MKRYRYAAAALACFITGALLDLCVFADGAPRDIEAERRIFGIFPVWGFLLLLAGIVMAVIIIVVEIFKRRMK